MKFLFSTASNSPQNKFHENLFKCSPKLDQSSDDEDDEYVNEHECSQIDLHDLSLPLTDTIAEFVQELSEDKFFLNDISFIFELSRKRAISPCAIVVALIYLKRLKSKTKQNLYNFNPISNAAPSYSSENYSAGCLSNTELCLISLLLASKYLVDEGEDDEIYNDEWAELVDFSVDKVNKLERSILKQMEWELYVSENEFWSFTKKLTERITRKKVKYQHYQCTYTDLDYLLSNSNQFSLNSLKLTLNYLAKIILICSSTVVYMALSSFLISSCVFHLKNQLSLLNTSTHLVLPNTNSSTPTFNSNNLVLTVSKEFIVGESSEFISNNNNEPTLTTTTTNSTSFYETFCSMNEKLSTSIFKLFERNKALKRADFVDLIQMKKNHYTYHNHYPIIQQFILK